MLIAYIELIALNCTTSNVAFERKQLDVPVQLRTVTLKYEGLVV